MERSTAIVYETVTDVPVESVVALYEAGGWWVESPQARAVIPAMVRGSFRFMIARAPGGTIVGMARVLSDGVSDAYIQDVVVLREWRGHGIGKALIARLVAQCRDRGIEWIGLVAEPGTRPFYESIGFGALEGYQPMRSGWKGGA